MIHGPCRGLQLAALCAISPPVHPRNRLANHVARYIELYGMLAPVLANASENGGPQPDDRLISMVAEEGLEPPTRGL